MTEEFEEEVKSFVSKAPATSSEVHHKIGEKYGKTRAQVDYALKKMAMRGEVKTKKTGEKKQSPRIFWKGELD